MHGCHETAVEIQGTEGGAYQWGLSNASEPWERAHQWPQDSMWTESNWPPGGFPELQLYQVGWHMSHVMLTSRVAVGMSLPRASKAKLKHVAR